MKTKVSVYVIRVDGKVIETCPIVDSYTTIFPEIDLSELPDHSVCIPYLTSNGWILKDNLLKVFDEEARHIVFDMDRICAKIEEFELEIGDLNVD